MVYILEDLNDEEIDCIFYEQELSHVIDDYISSKTWKIDKILETAGKGSNKKHFVSWRGWPKKFNSWVLARDIKRL